MAEHRNFLKGAVAGALVLGLVAGPAAADVVTRKDPKDTLGRLDIRRISHGHAGEDAVTHTITTYGEYSSRLLDWSQRPGGMLLLFIDGVDDGWERIVVVRWRDGRLRAPIFDEDRRVGMAQVTRPNRRTVKVTLQKRQLGDLGDPPQYLWRAISLFRNRGRCKGVFSCLDGAPNGREVRHRLSDISQEAPPAEGVDAGRTFGKTVAEAP
jgi:hypothetical protein